MVGRPSFYFNKMKKIDITKLSKYGRLKIIEEDFKDIKTRYVFAQCDCGVIKSIKLSHIIGGLTTSCGCFRNEQIKKSNSTHNNSSSNLYTRWCKIKERCFNVSCNNYHRYGGRGITMCDEWKNDYTKFRDWSLANGYRKELQIDRIDNNGNYKPNNCRWVTSKVNGNNKRTTLLITYKNKTFPLKTWCVKLGLNYKTVWERIKYGKWEVGKAFETPVKKKE